MPFQPAPNIAQVRLEGRLDNQLTLNNLFFEISGGGINVTNLTTLVQEVMDWWTINLVPLLSENFTSVRVVGIDLTTATGPVAEVGASGAGGVAVESAPNNVAAAVSFRTAQRGRSYRGRNFVPAIPNSVVLLNTLTDTFIGDLVAAYSMMVGAGTFVAGWQWVVLSRFTANAPRANGLGVPVTSVVMVGTSVRSMRSREIGHGA